MRILHVYKDYYPVVGGIENHIKLLAEAQAAAGHQVTVLVTNRERQMTEQMLNNVRVIKTSRLFSAASTPISPQLANRLAREHPDITHLHFPYPPGEVAQLLFGTSTGTVITYHSDVVRQVKLLKIYKPTMMRVLAKADRIIATSQAYLESSPILTQFKDKCTVIPYGINQQPFVEYDRLKAAEIRRRYGPGPVVLFVGVLRYYKGLTYLLDAMRSVAASLIIVGEGPMSETLRRQVFSVGLANRVFFVGRVSDDELPAYYHAADCFVLPASERSEAFGLVLVEALASGLPIVSTEIATATSFVNLNGVSGIVVPPRDSEALAKALNLLISDSLLRLRLAEGAKARVSLFEAERMVQQILCLYECVLTSSGSDSQTA